MEGQREEGTAGRDRARTHAHTQTYTEAQTFKPQKEVASPALQAEGADPAARLPSTWNSRKPSPAAGKANAGRSECASTGTGESKICKETHAYIQSFPNTNTERYRLTQHHHHHHHYKVKTRCKPVFLQSVRVAAARLQKTIL
jgi:hypothetical protein